MEEDFKLIGVYKIDHKLQRWVVGDEEMIVQNVFHGRSHVTSGAFDWMYKHHRMIDEGAMFNVDFILPDKVKTPSNEVQLSI